MPYKNNVCLAPWVICGENNLLLGSKLTIIKVPHLNISRIPKDKLNELIKKNYITDINQKRIAGCYQSKKLYNQPNWIWVPDRSFLEVALLLKKHLSKLNFSSYWEIALSKKTILKNLTDNHLKKPFIIRLSHKEPIEEKNIMDLYGDLIGKVQIIWIGETIEGSHFGPIIHTISDIENYLFATKEWYFSKKLIKLGFKKYWPLPIYTLIQTSPEQVAKTIFRITHALQGTCILVEENREVCLWTRLLSKKTTEPNFFKNYFWSKGLIRNFNLTKFEFINEAYFATCRTPCNGIDYLEGNSGKGITSSNALYSLVGESVERFSAWRSNKMLLTSKQPKKTRKATIYKADQFHPFGLKWDHSLASSREELPMYKVKNEIDPSNVCFVPECLIPFPYEASEPQYDITTSSTAGLASHSNYEKAVIKGALELFERHDFYNSFLSQKVGFILDFSKVSPESEACAPNLISLANRLKANQLIYWCFVYNLHSTLPIVYSFIFDQKYNFFSRGAGSGYSLLEATSNALVEALQIRQQFLRNEDNRLSQGYRDWKTPAVIEEICSYLERFQRLPFSEHPLNFIQYTPDLLLQEIKKSLYNLQKPLLVATLPCPITKWRTVRVLIPGFTTHQYPSESLGGRKIAKPIFKYSIPS